MRKVRSNKNFSFSAKDWLLTSTTDISIHINLTTFYIELAEFIVWNFIGLRNQDCRDKKIIWKFEFEASIPLSWIKTTKNDIPSQISKPSQKRRRLQTEKYFKKWSYERFYF